MRLWCQWRSVVRKVNGNGMYLRSRKTPFLCSLYRCQAGSPTSLWLWGALGLEWVPSWKKEQRSDSCLCVGHRQRIKLERPNWYRTSGGMKPLKDVQDKKGAGLANFPNPSFTAAKIHKRKYFLPPGVPPDFSALPYHAWGGISHGCVFWLHKLLIIIDSTVNLIIFLSSELLNREWGWKGGR